jgi:3-methyl-2-oxobutanoate hydroxymethyltransferase
MGAGAGCDAQYLFANDILGYTEGHIPRHSRVCRDFGAELARLQAERITAFAEFVADVAQGDYPEDRHLVAMPQQELDAFMDRLGSGEGPRLP